MISYSPEEERDASEVAEIVKQADRRAESSPAIFTMSGIERALSEFGQLDLFVNDSAFQMTHDSVEDFTTEEFDRTFKTNVYARFWLCGAALPRMRPARWRNHQHYIIQVFDPRPNLLAYAATKGVVVSFTKGLSKIAMRKGVRVNAVAPGPVWTPLIPATMPEEKVKNFGEDTPLGPAAQPVEVALYFFS